MTTLWHSGEWLGALDSPLAEVFLLLYFGLLMGPKSRFGEVIAVGRVLICAGSSDYT